MATVTMQAAPVVPTWDDTVLRTVERQLAHYVGPMAKVMIRQAATRAHDISELYGLLSENIHDPVGRRRFYESGRTTDGSSLTSPPRARSTGTQTQTLSLPLEKAFVDQTTMRLAVYLGPIARVVASRAAQKAASQEEFVQLVAGHLGAQERGAFLREIGFDG
jgi:serine/threonine-protein kinase